MVAVSSLKPKPIWNMTVSGTLDDTGSSHYNSKMDTLLKEAQGLFRQQLQVDSLLALSKNLQVEFQDRLQSSTQCMLPSHNYTLPTGQEQGTYLALEVGGSTLRVALVDLDGRNSMKEQPLRIRRIITSAIDNRIRDLRGLAFFDWIAAKTGEMLSADKEAMDHAQLREPLPMGIAWAFPIDQTSIRSGDIIGMGKGFHCSIYKGHDLGDLITEACQRANLNIRLDSIVNDSSAAVLSRAYLDPATRLAVILGTGINAGIHLQMSSLHASKFGSREFPSTPTSHVLVNTELSLFGKHAFATTRWDDHLNATHMLPDYQPMEYLIAGGYMGEIVRLVMVEATATSGLLSGRLPPALAIPYSLDTRTLAAIEADTYPSLSPSCTLFQEKYALPSPPSPADMHFIRQIIFAVSTRSRCYFSAAVYALSSLLHEARGDSDAEDSDGLDHISIGCDGSVINKYPGYMQECQRLLDQLAEIDPERRKRVVLESAGESAVLGAGVAVAMANMGT
ncbi:MAG: hypothetical protein Q9174_005381 [Haloplaca sp. 1 TL-2023]